ncbi:MAG: hypothetical protein ABIR11_03165 [Candidatus Limnocylindrales bacterium]
MVGNAIGGGMDRLVRWVVLPVTGVIPVLSRTGILFVAFAVLWLAFLAALVAGPAALDAAWGTVGSLPMIVQAVTWVLFLPLMGAGWAWATDWPVVVRLVIVVAIAGWNLLVFLPARTPTTQHAAS